MEDIKKKELVNLIDIEFDELKKTFKSENKEIIKLLQFHLHAEQLLERIILAKLERGDKVLDKGGLSFHQKLCLVESFGHVDDKYIVSLRKANRLRNDCAHNKELFISKDKLDLIGRPLGKDYTDTLRRCQNDLNQIMVEIFLLVGAPLIRTALNLEYPEMMLEK